MSIARPPAAGSDLLTRLRDLIDRQRLGAARPLLNAVLRLVPPGEELAELEARLLLLEGNMEGACAVLDDALAQAPGSVTLLLARATARRQAGNTAGAARDAAEAVLLEPTQARAKAHLGACLNQLGHHAEARACLEEAVAATPGDGSYRRHLAAAQAAGGDQEAAAATLQEGLRRTPADVGLRLAAILSRMRRGDFVGAEQVALAGQRAGIADARLLGLLGHARSSLGRHAEAAEAYAEALKLAPEDPYVGHLAAAGGLAPDAGRASRDYVRVVFDGYAPRFDPHLIALGYRVPGLIRAELTRLRPAHGRFGPVLDLGCGTGLLAVAAADDGIGPWVGVDLSPGMLAEAKRRELYAELHEADIDQFLATDPRRFPVIVAGDAMPYFGDLTLLLRGVAERLLPAGHFLFSTERLAADGPDAPAWHLGPLGRYAHSEAHIMAAAGAAGLTVAAMPVETVRLEVDVPVAGLIVTLQRPPA